MTEQPRMVQVRQRVLKHNDVAAGVLRGRFYEAGVFVVSLVSSPGAGKTALLELIRQSFCRHVVVLPEAASIVFGGGFPRHDDLECQRADNGLFGPTAACVKFAACGQSGGTACALARL